MQRLNFTLDEPTIKLLDRLAGQFYAGNKSQTVRAALESLAAHTGHEGWVIAGYSPVAAPKLTHCHTCGDPHRKGEILYRPVFQRGGGPGVVPRLPSESWLACATCVEHSTG
jgi:hypothetical protein